MGLRSTRLPHLLGLILLALPVTIQWGCSSFPSQNKPQPTYSYRLEGALVKDLNTDFTHIVATPTRDDSTLPGAEIRFGGDSLAYLVDSTYYRVVLPAGDYPAGSYKIEIRDSTFFHDSAMTEIAGDFAIQNVLPARREKLSFEDVSLEWTSSSATDGYVIAAVKRDLAYAATGHVQYVTLGTPKETFENDAFNLPSGEPDTGWYYLYVYSYVGSPDSSLSATLLPVPMPSQLPDSISVHDLEGRFGTVLVAPFDSMHVIASK